MTIDDKGHEFDSDGRVVVGGCHVSAEVARYSAAMTHQL
jgi:hypothetical protein